MHRVIRYLFFTLFVITIVVIYFLYDRFSYANELPYYSIGAKSDSILTIGIIGDSWVANRKLDSILNRGLSYLGIDNEIFSSGQSGAKSKLVYQNMFKDHTDINSSKSVIERNPEFCIVIAGVNDAQGQIGSMYYSYHIYLIAKALLRFGIKPVIVSLPEFGIVKATEQMNYIKKTRNKIFSIINNNGKVNNIRRYRVELCNLLKETKLMDKIIYVEFDKVYNSFEDCKELYTDDGVHLNNEGFKLLSDSLVVRIKNGIFN